MLIKKRGEISLSGLAFPDPDALGDRIQDAGFREVRFELLFGGIAVLPMWSTRRADS